MLKIADLLDEIDQACEMHDISGSYLRVLSDANFLATKATNDPQKWQEGYRSVFGHYPSQHLFEQMQAMLFAALKNSGDLQKPLGI